MLLKILKLGRKSKRYIEIEALIHLALSSMPQDPSLKENAQDVLEMAFDIEDLEQSPSRTFDRAES